MAFSKLIGTVRVSCLIISVMMGHVLYAKAEAANGNEAKVTSPGGYVHLYSKSQDKGVVKVIVKVRASFSPESLLHESNLHEQRTEILRTQNQVITELGSKGHKPSRVHKYKYTPHIAITVDSAALDALLLLTDVISVEEDILVPPTDSWNVTRIGASQLHTSSITGSGVAVAILDTGVDKTHPYLNGSVVSEACYSTNDAYYGSSSLCPQYEEESTTVGSAMPYAGNCPTGECSHGTHVAGIVAGRDEISESPGPGVAPEASIIAIQIYSRFDAEADCGVGYAPCVMSWSSDELKGLERVYELRNSYSIASVNMSLGGGTYTGYCDKESPAMKSAIDNLRAAGIATVIASGNDYSCAISFPACISSAISVGATDYSDTVELYSNGAPFLSLLAPGSSITSSIPLADRGGYESWSGTSMATPHVAGAWALMKQAFPYATVDNILDAFTATGLSVYDQYCSVTKQRVNVYEAYNLIGFATNVTIGTQITISGSNFGTKKGKVLIGGISTNIIEWTDTRIITNVKKVPLPVGLYVITVKRWPLNGISSALSAGTATIKTPELDTLATDHGTPKVEIKATGKFFSTKKGKVYLEYDKDGQTKKKNCKITYWYMNPTTGASELKFLVPKPSKRFPAGPYPLKVANRIGIATAKINFTIEPSP